MMRQTFQQEEAEQILRKAITLSPDATGTLSGDITEERLKDMAAELGVDPATLEAAVRQWREERTVEQDRAEFIRKRRAEFTPHLWSYVGVNTFLLIINLMTSPGYLWAIWPILGWGLGLFFHAMASLPTRGATFEEEFEKWRKKRQKDQKKKQRKQNASADDE